MTAKQAAWHRCLAEGVRTHSGSDRAPNDAVMPSKIVSNCNAAQRAVSYALGIALECMRRSCRQHTLGMPNEACLRRQHIALIAACSHIATSRPELEEDCAARRRVAC